MIINQPTSQVWEKKNNGWNLLFKYGDFKIFSSKSGELWWVHIQW